jgi:glycosyltransferase involved in cell wall biosynthesis
MSVSMLAEQLVKKGIHITVLTTTANGKGELSIKTQQPQIVEGVNIIYFKRVTKDHTQFSPSLLIYLWKISKEYDIIHVHAWWNLVSLFSTLIGKIRGVTVIVSPRGTLSNYSFNNKNNIIKSFIHILLTKPLLSNCFIHATSESESTELKKIIKPRHFFKIKNFVKLPENVMYSKVEDRDLLKIIFLSRIEEKKGLDLLIKAIADLNFRYRLTIVGDGNIEYINMLKNLIEKNEISEFVNWLGFRTDEKFELLYNHDLMVLPSYDENFGNVVIESLSVGTAVIVTENVGLSSYVSENNLGWVCKTDHLSLRSDIQKANAQRAKLKEIRLKAPFLINQDFDNDKLVKKYINMYHKTINS